MNKKLVHHIHEKHEEILKGFRKVLEDNGVEGVDISKFGLLLRSGAPPCPNGQPANFRCALNASGEYECKWVCD